MAVMWTATRRWALHFLRRAHHARRRGGAGGLANATGALTAWGAMHSSIWPPTILRNAQALAANEAAMPDALVERLWSIIQHLAPGKGGAGGAGGSGVQVRACLQAP